MFGCLADNATGIWIAITVVFLFILAAQWIAWSLRWGRFGQEFPKERASGFILAELATNIIDEFRHLPALVLVLLFGGVLAFGLVKAGDDARGIRAAGPDELQWSAVR